MTDVRSTGMMTVLMSQESLKTEEDAEKRLEEVSKEQNGYLGGRVLPPGKAQKKIWLLQTYFVDNGGKPPPGMARLHIPADAPESYGIKAA